MLLSRLAARRWTVAAAAASSAGSSFPAANSSATGFFLASSRPAAEKGSRPLHTFIFAGRGGDKGGIYRVQTESSPGIVSQAASASAAGRPGRSLHTLRDLGTGDNAFGAVVAAALAGGLGILIFQKHPDDAGSNVTNEDPKEVSLKPEVTDNKHMQVEVTDMEKRDVDMEARFREWMKLVGKVYPNQEEERKRFEIFKGREANKRDPPYLPTSPYADMTYQEIRNKRVNYHQYLEEEAAFISLMKKREQKLKKEGKIPNDVFLFPESRSGNKR